MKWRLISSETILNSPWVRVYKQQYETPTSVVSDYFVVERADFVLVVARRKNALLMIRQYRPGTDKEYICLPAGYIRDGETPIEAAGRELTEETGYEGKGFKLVGSLDPLPGYVRSTAFVVECEVVDQRPAPSASDEATEILEIDTDQVVELIRRGEIDEMQAVAAILLTRR